MNTDKRLWAVSTNGNVYHLGTKSSLWQHVHNQGQVLQGFKRVSASPQGAWGLGCDHQVYVYVEGSDVPIRCQITTFENERWVPSRGWSSRNLVRGVDPWQWSSEDNNVFLPKESFKLPSDNWVWESDWCVDENVQGFLTDKGGWRYALVDFRSQFSHQKTFKSCVRRRKWIRHNKYIATDVWARIPSIHMDPMEEPIVDLAGGGQDIPNQPPGYLSVWVVTIDGRVLYRSGISQQCPEGLAWVDIPIGEGEEVLSVSVGPTDMVWAITWSGNLVVRAGIDWQNPKGTHWMNLNAPDPEDKLVQVAVGDKTVWVTSVSGNVWMRKAVKPDTPEGATTKDYLTGSGWLHMVHKMRMVGVGPLDRVWGIDYDDRQIYFRQGVSVEEPSGRTWALTSLPHSQSRHSHISESSQSVQSFHSSASSDSSRDRHSLRLDDDWTVKNGAKVVLTEGGEGDVLNDEVVNGKVPNAATKTIVVTDTASGERINGAGFSDRDKNNGELTSHKNHVICSDGGACSSNSGAPDIEPSKQSDKPNIINSVHSESQAQADLLQSTISQNTESSLETISNQNSSPTLTPTRSPKKNTAQHLVQHIQHSKTVSKAVKKSKKVVKFLRDRMVKDILRDDLQGDSNDPFSVRYSPSTSSLEIAENEADGADSDSNAKSVSSDAVCDIEEEASRFPKASEDDAVSFLSSFENQLETEPDDNGMFWLWLSATGCLIPDEAHVTHWFHKKQECEQSASVSADYQRQLSQSSWRTGILSLLHERRERDQAPFSAYKVAIESSCWTKKGQMRWWRDTEKKAKWIAADLELVQDSDTQEKDGTFTVQYVVSKQPKHLTFALSEIMAVSILTEPGQATVFGLHLLSRITALPRLPTLKLSASCEEEMEDWVAALSVACCDFRGVSGSHHHCSVWALTHRGNVFVHHPVKTDNTEFVSAMFWHQYGGHLKVIETCPLGITWGLAYDGKAYLYTGGYGGAFFKGMATSPHGIFAQSDTKEMFVYENQRWRPITGYTDRVLFTDTYKWSDESGKKECTKDGTKLPCKHWTWTTDWMVDRRLQSGVDKDGWQYGRKLNRPFSSHPRINSVIRRRRWVRRCSTTTSGPWQEVPPHSLRDISLSLEVSEGTVALWAVGVGGEMLYRMGVTVNNPQGTSWVHVPADLQFISVSVGGGGNVWAVTHDGSARLRHGVSSENTIGDCWIHVSPPEGAQLASISAGSTNVWAVNTNNELFCRKGVTPSHCEGSEWVGVGKNIRQVSCGPKDQVWAIQDQVVTKEGKTDGIVCRRGGLGLDKTKHGSWDCGVGGGWSYVSVRGWTK